MEPPFQAQPTPQEEHSRREGIAARWPSRVQPLGPEEDQGSHSAEEDASSWDKHWQLGPVISLHAAVCSGPAQSDYRQAPTLGAAPCRTESTCSWSSNTWPHTNWTSPLSKNRHDVPRAAQYSATHGPDDGPNRSHSRRARMRPSTTRRSLSSTPHRTTNAHEREPQCLLHPLPSSSLPSSFRNRWRGAFETGSER